MAPTRYAWFYTHPMADAREEQKACAGDIVLHDSFGAVELVSMTSGDMAIKLADDHGEQMIKSITCSHVQ